MHRNRSGVRGERGLRRLVPGSVLLIVLLAGTILAAQEKPVAATDDWLGWAGTAWKYFAPSANGGNVNSLTGLNRANQWWGFLTDWDLASYVVATLHAKDLGLISETGTWGASYRLDKVLTFLEQRPLRPEDGLPYWCYKWDAYPYQPGSSGPSLTGDAGMHLLALDLVKQAYPSLATRVDAIVDRVRAAYLAEYYDASGRLIADYDWYRYYDLSGFEKFGFPVDASKQALEEALARPHVNVYGQSLARVETTAEPFLIGLFLLPMDSRFQDYAYRTYKAMEGRFTNLGILTAWSECARDVEPNYIYEWVVKADGSTWQLQPSGTYTPVVTSKAVFGYHALYHTSYTQSLMDKVLPKIQTSNIGFTEGTDEAPGGNVGNGLQVATDKTNSLIISAARYAISPHTVTVTATGTSTKTSVSYVSATTTKTVTSYTSTSTSTSTVPVLTTVVLVPLTITSTHQGTQFLTSVVTTTTTSYTSTTTSTIVVPTTVALVPLTRTSTAQGTQLVTSTRITTVTSYTGTTTSTSTIPTTVALVPLTRTSTAQSTGYVTSTSTTTVTSYTATTTSTSTSVVYTTVTVSPGGAGTAAASNPLAYLGFLSLLAIGVDRVTVGRSRRTVKVRSMMERRCSRN